MMSEHYRDWDGNEVSLDTLCRHEPAWAANAIRTLKQERDAARAEVERLRAEVIRLRFDLSVITEHRDNLLVEVRRRTRLTGPPLPAYERKEDER